MQQIKLIGSDGDGLGPKCCLKGRTVPGSKVVTMETSTVHHLAPVTLTSESVEMYTYLNTIQG